MAATGKSPVTARDAAPAPTGRSTRPGKPRVNHPQYALALTEPTFARELLLATPVRRLWFCIYLPNLPLEANGPGEGARAIVEEQRGIHRVLLADADARAAGVMPGQSGTAALALLPTLKLDERNVLREQQVLESLATSLEQFTSFVSIASHNVLLLEIAGSLRLFGGLQRLRQQVATELRQQGFDAALAIAPTPLGATWLARGGRRTCIREPANLATAIRTLSLNCLDWPHTLCAALTGMGITSIGDCLRLPREGFARRFGAGRLIELDRALGRSPDPRISWRSPKRFCADYEMPEEQSDRERLLAICRELLLSHEQFLLARQLGTQRVLLSFFHLKASATQLSLGCVEADRSTDGWFDLLCLRFEQLSLPEPVIAIRLRGGSTQALPAETACLTGRTCPERRYSMPQLAERIAARIGDQSVHGIEMVADHRPQFAWCEKSLFAAKAADVLSAVRCGLRRPLWMLPEPALLPVRQGYPLHRGRLTLIEGPERLETGWWDENGIARDYYTAVNPRGMRLWIFRNRNKATWYLHGIFG